MLPKQYRLPSSTRLKQARFYKTALFSVKVAPNNLEQNRFAFLVRKKVDKRAVVRNRIRRVFRSCIEEMLSELQPRQDMLFLLERGIMDKPREELFQELKAFLQEKHLLKAK